MNIQDLCQEYNASQWDLTENDVKLIIDSGKEGKTWGEKTDIVMSKLCDLSGLDEYDVDEDKGLYLFYCKLCQLCESTMKLKEAKEILNENGFILEGSYKDIIHQKLGEIRQKRADDESKYKGQQIQLGKIMSKVYKETKEFIDDLADELVSDEVTCNYDKKHWRIHIQVKDKKFILEMSGWGEFRFKEHRTIGYTDWNEIFSIETLKNIAVYLEKAFDYITKESV